MPVAWACVGQRRSHPPLCLTPPYDPTDQADVCFVCVTIIRSERIIGCCVGVCVYRALMHIP